MSIRNTANNKKNVKEGRPRVLVILGPTSSGKTALAVRLAAELGGEIVSADSRQVYRGLDVGTGKDLGEYHVGGRKIKYHLIDVADPNERFDLAQYQKLAFRAIKDIMRRKKLPIIVGGSGLYLQALVDNYRLAEVQPDLAERVKLERLSVSQLLQRLQKIKPEFAARLNNSDCHNPRRLVRYLEIAQGGGAVNSKQESSYDFLVLGLDCPMSILRDRIVQRLLVMLEKEGLVDEVYRLHKNGLSWQRLESFGLEYRFVARHLQGQLSYLEMVEKLSVAIYQFAKRQKTWFRRWEKQGQEIIIVKDLASARKTIKKWL
jgi:tRNA dimethylallyltransferase